MIERVWTERKLVLSIAEIAVKSNSVTQQCYTPLIAAIWQRFLKIKTYHKTIAICLTLKDICKKERETTCSMHPVWVTKNES
jgi:hypothetical protein